jgi:hypothetical protein
LWLQKREGFNPFIFLQTLKSDPGSISTAGLGYTTLFIRELHLFLKNQRLIPLALQVPPPPVMCSTPKAAHPSPGPGHHLLLDTIPESEAPGKISQPPNSAAGTKRLPPPTLPKPQKSRPQPPPKPKKAADSGEDSFQVTYRTLIKKKIKFSSHIRKFRVEQLQSHI